LIITIGLLGSAIPAFPDSISLGISLWYAQFITIENQDNVEDTMVSKSQPAILAGPFISYSFSPQWDASFRFLIGKGYHDFKYTENDEGTLQDVRELTDWWRYDSDIVLSYKLLSWISVYGGIKSQGYKSDGKSDYTLNSTGAYIGTSTGGGYLFLIGPGAGISLSQKLFTNCYGFFTLGALLMRGHSWIDGSYGIYNTEMEGVLESYGLNTNIALSYYFPNYEVALNLGYRFQYIRGKETNDSVTTTPTATYTASESVWSNNIDHGVTFTVTYFIDLH